ncbi:PspC domain-containing protein [Geodermatophilus sp. URMC 64]
MTAIPPTVDQPTAEQPPPTPAPRPQLRRSGSEKMLGGVCGGLAEYSGIDPLLWRVGFVGLTVAGGAGVLVYLLLWVLMPSGPVGPDDRTNVLDEWVARLHDKLTGERTTPGRP